VYLLVLQSDLMILLLTQGVIPVPLDELLALQGVFLMEIQVLLTVIQDELLMVKLA